MQAEEVAMLDKVVEFTTSIFRFSFCLFLFYFVLYFIFFFYDILLQFLYGCRGFSGRNMNRIGDEANLA